MATIDPRLVDLLKAYGEDNKSVWDCHGTWVAYHAAIERMAAKAGIRFDKPDMIVNDPASKIVVVCVSASMGDKTEWSFGEVTPQNNKNSYPYAMAEKRAKDRVALKLLGMAGLVYSEEEADDFKTEKPARGDESRTTDQRSDVGKREVAAKDKPISAAEQKRQLAEIDKDLLDVSSEADLKRCAAIWKELATRDGWSRDYMLAAKEKFDAKRAELNKRDVVDDIEDTFPGSRVVNETVREQHVLEAGE